MEVDRLHYFNERYLSEPRFNSYRFLLMRILSGKYRSIAEIGKGPGILAAILKQASVEVTTIDYAEDLSPDVVCDVRELGALGKKFNAVICAQVLEHLPFDDFKKSVSSLISIASSEVIITIPDQRSYSRIAIKVPGLVEKTIRIDLSFWRKYWLVRDNSEHQWEMNCLPYSEELITMHLNEVCAQNGWEVSEHGRISGYPYHHFFSLRPEKGPVEHSILLGHVYADDNKGDLGIIQGTLQGLRASAARRNQPVSVTALSMFSPVELRHPYPHRLLWRIADGIQPSPVSQRYIESRGLMRSIIKSVAVPLKSLSVVIRCGAWRMTGWNWVLGRRLTPTLQASIIVCKGGSLLHCNSSLRAHFFLLRMLMPLASGILLRKPVVVLGQSVGPFETKISAFLMKNIAKNLNRLWVRDMPSLNELQRIGVPEDRLGLMPDAAFLMRRMVTVPDKQGLPFEPILGVTALNVTRDPADQIAYETKMAAVIIRFLALNARWCVRFIPQVIGPDPWQDDRFVQRRIAEKLEPSLLSRITLMNDDLDSLELCSVYSQIDLLLATRLHSSIFAAVAGTPAVVLEYQQAKAQGAFTWLERPNDVISWRSSEDLIFSRLQDKVARIEDERNWLRIRVDQLADQLDSVCDEVIDLSIENVSMKGEQRCA